MFFILTVTATDSLPETVDVTAKVCAVWYFCYSDSTTTDMCSSLTSVDEGSACPGAGSYSFLNTVTSPGSNSWDLPSWLQGYTFSVTVTFADSSGSVGATTCTGKATPTGEESSSSASYQQSLCGVAVAALVAAVWARRRQLRTRDTAARESLLEMEHTTNNDTAQGTRSVV